MMRRKKMGFTLVEVMMAMAILAIISMAFFALFAQSASIRSRAATISEAAYTAQNIIEEAKNGEIANSGFKNNYYIEIYTERFASDRIAISDGDKILKNITVKVYSQKDLERPLAMRQSIIAVSQ